MKRYTNEFQSYVTPGKIESNCNEIAFKNAGTVDCLLNGFTLQPGDVVSVSGNQNEIDVTDYNVSFSSLTGARLDVIRKRYVS